MATRQVRIELKAPTWESVVVIDGVAQQMIERVTLNAGAKEPMPRLELTRIVTHEEARARGEYGMLDMDVATVHRPDRADGPAGPSPRRPPSSCRGRLG